MTLEDAIKQAVAKHNSDPSALGGVVDTMRLKYRMTHAKVCAAILKACPELGDTGTVDAMLYACDEAESQEG